MVSAVEHASPLSIRDLVVELGAAYEKVSTRSAELELENANLRKLVKDEHRGNASVLKPSQEAVGHDALHAKRIDPPSRTHSMSGERSVSAASDKMLDDRMYNFQQDLLAQLADQRLVLESILDEQHNALSAMVMDFCVPGETAAASPSNRSQCGDRSVAGVGQNSQPVQAGSMGAVSQAFAGSSTQLFGDFLDRYSKWIPGAKSLSRGLMTSSAWFRGRERMRGPSRSTVGVGRLMARKQQDSKFDVLIGVVILLNAIVLCVQAEWHGWQHSVLLGLAEEDGRWENAKMWFDVLEHGFNLVFMAELVYRLYHQGWWFFAYMFNVFDMFIVLSSVADLYIFQPLTNAKGMGNVTFLRFLRMAKLMRALRMVRTFKLFGGLRVLVKAVASSMVSLAWSMVTLGIFMVMGGLLTVNLVSSIIEDLDEDITLRLWTWEYYGTSARALYTMFEITMSGCWPNYVRPLLDAGHHGYAIWFMVYVTFVVFAVIRVITAIFLKETLDAANNDVEMMLAEKAKKRDYYLQKLKSVFKAADKSRDGTISYEEFEEILDDPTICNYLQALELEVHEGVALFHMLDNGDGQITCEEFIKGVSRLKGQARSIDLIALRLDSEKTLKSLDDLKRVICPSFNAPKKRRFSAPPAAASGGGRTTSPSPRREGDYEMKVCAL